MNTTFKNLVLMVLMVGAALLAPTLRATQSLADQLPPIDLEHMVPRQFGEWREQPGLAVQLVNPEQQATIDRIYSSTLSRTYVNSQGYRIMLSIAYGRDQSDALQLHKPEVCYPAQGFQLAGKKNESLHMPNRVIHAVRLKTHLAQRYEPVTYWTVIGNKVTGSRLDKKLTEMSYSILHKTMPDGMLVRISSIDEEAEAAFQIHSAFAADLIQAIAPETQERFAGTTIK